ncbi:ABC transporter ATP-binding protein [Chengkuizengella axinellae]|uniref:ABC transporter ATP-binding protein n=1 Tax=Chengkuizengella axinellae TaxID=3064388 RepID=A0ABT9J327_9BACL|nr:ABC transporter ATP-binding protein [Chengkuizengella sp. 2205SS18-9]MDP5275399.1 ABC transporter ATP-binding protein [Chengkuizengella sp. 2205SS18-9]
MENIIEVKNLSKTFGNKIALKNVSFNVKRGETFGFLGPSGSGKTTTIKMLTSQLLQTTGEIKVFNQPLKKQKDASFMKRIGILTDNSGLYDRLTVLDNLTLYSELYNVERKQINEILEVVNLQNETKTQVKKLSKGMKQRVTLARAMLHKPELLFLDEPTSALDPVNMKHIHDGLRELNKQGTTIFLTTHNMMEAEQICDRVAFLHQGEIKQLDTPQNLRIQYMDESVTLLLKDNRSIVVNKDEKGAEEIYQYMRSGEVVSIHSNEPTLGEIFVQITGRELA